MIARTAIFMIVLFAGCGALVEEEEEIRIESFEPERAERLPLRYAEASEVHHALEALVSDPKGPRVVADSRTNSIIVVGTSGEIDIVKQVVSVMDVESPVEMKQE